MNQQLEAAIAEIRATSKARRDNAINSDPYEIGTANGLIQSIEILRKHFTEPPAVDAVEAEREACAKMRDALLEIRKIIENGDRWRKEGTAANIHIIVVDTLQTSDAIRDRSTPAVDAVAAEREACAKVADAHFVADSEAMEGADEPAFSNHGFAASTAKQIGEDIRARSTSAVASEPAVDAKAALLEDLEAWKHLWSDRHLSCDVKRRAVIDKIGELISAHTVGSNE